MCESIRSVRADIWSPSAKCIRTCHSFSVCLRNRYDELLPKKNINNRRRRWTGDALRIQASVAFDMDYQFHALSDDVGLQCCAVRNLAVFG